MGLLGGGFAQADGQVLLADGHGFVAATIAGPAAATRGVVLLTAAGDMRDRPVADRPPRG